MRPRLRAKQCAGTGRQGGHDHAVAMVPGCGVRSPPPLGSAGHPRPRIRGGGHSWPRDGTGVHVWRAERLPRMPSTRPELWAGRTAALGRPSRLEGRQFAACNVAHTASSCPQMAWQARGERATIATAGAAGRGARARLAASPRPTPAQTPGAPRASRGQGCFPGHEACRLATRRRPVPRSRAAEGQPRLRVLPRYESAGRCGTRRSWPDALRCQSRVKSTPRSSSGWWKA